MADDEVMRATGAEGDITRLMRQLAEVSADHAPYAPGLPEGTAITIGVEQPGRYELRGLLGRGGQSVVHLALDTTLGRQVAFKQRLGGAPHGTEGTLLQGEVRFVREARITAQLDHPGIAPIHEIGRRADGSLYATQKLVGGRTLGEALAACAAPADRLALLPALLGACQAVASAHARGVIHRDLKPQNIMVGELGEVVVLDWGLARTREPQAPTTQSLPLTPPPTTAPPRTEGPVTLVSDAAGPIGGTTPIDSLLDSDLTREGHIFGTPHYMSPEQAAGLHAAVDERSDVWSLGVILYELLTGQRPYGASGPGTPGWDEGARRLAPVLELTPDASAELAAVAVRALATHPADRYAHAGELAHELSQYLAGRLVRAHSYSSRELLVRWARRHAAILLTAAVAVLLLTVGSALAVRRIVAERDRASLEARTAQRVSAFLTSMFEVSDPSVSRGSTVTAHELLDRAAAEVESGLAGEPELQARLMATMGNTYSGLGLTPDAHRLLQRAYQTRHQVLGPEHPDTLSSARDLAGVLDEAGRYPEAEALYRETLATLRRTRGDDHPDTLRTLGNLGSVLFAEGRYPESEGITRDALERFLRLEGPDGKSVLSLRNSLAIALLAQGKAAEAEPLLVETLAAKRRLLGPDHPSTMKSMLNLGAFLLDGRRHAEALTVFDALLAIQSRVLGAEHPDTLQTRHNRAMALELLGRHADAVEVLLPLVEAERRVLGGEHPNSLQTASGLGGALSGLGRHGEAEPLLRAVLTQQRRVLGPVHSDVAETEVNLAGLLAATGRPDEALDHLEAAVAAGLEPRARADLAGAPDLAPLRGLPRLEALLRPPAPGPSSPAPAAPQR